jgi:hypothetical protein
MMKKSLTSAFILMTIAGIMAVFIINNRAEALQEATPEATAEATQNPSISVVTMEGTRPNEGDAYVRVVAASPDVPAISVFLNDQAVTSDLKFGNSTDFVEFPADTYTIAVNTPAGSGILSKSIVLAPGTSVTLILTGLTNGADKTALKFSAFLTERSPTKGKTRLEVVNAVPDAPSIDVMTDKPLLTDIAFGKSGDASLNLDAGSYDLHLVSSGQLDSTVLNLKDSQLKTDMIYTLVATGKQGDGSVKPLMLTTTSLPSSSPEATPEATSTPTS